MRWVSRVYMGLFAVELHLYSRFLSTCGGWFQDPMDLVDAKIHGCSSPLYKRA